MLIISALSIIILVLLAGLCLRYAKSNGINRTSLGLMLQMEADTFSFQDDHVLPYRLYRPQITANKQYPLIVSLQSAYGRGTNNIGQLDEVVELLLKSEMQQKHSGFILAPQCPKGMEWNDSPPTKPPYVNIDMASLPTSWRQKAVVTLIQEMVDRYPIDRKRIYVVGASMGATGIWSTLYRYPDLFAGALIMNGRSDPAIAEFIKTPILVYHGKHDTLAPSRNSEAMVAALQGIGKKAELRLVEGGHGIASLSVNAQSMEWLFQQQLTKDVDHQFALNLMLVPQ